MVLVAVPMGLAMVETVLAAVATVRGLEVPEGEARALVQMAVVAKVLVV